MKKYQINLIQEKSQDFVDKVVYFFLHYLRYIIVITQIVVIGVFFFRFQVDQEIIDLKESIEQKQEILRITQPLVVEATALNNRIEQIEEILKKQERFSFLKRYIFSVIPNSIVLGKLEINEKEIILSGLSANIASIQALSARLKIDRRFRKVEIERMAKTDEGFEFVMTLDLN